MTIYFVQRVFCVRSKEEETGKMEEYLKKVNSLVNEKNMKKL